MATRASGINSGQRPAGYYQTLDFYRTFYSEAVIIQPLDYPEISASVRRRNPPEHRE